MSHGYRVWDTHTHLGEALHSGRKQTVLDLLRVMDREGIDRSVCIPFPVVADYRATHDLIAAAVRQYPDRLTGTICLDPFVARDKFNDEVRRCAEEFGFRALKLQPQYQALNPLWPRNDFFFEAAVRHKLPLIVHTGAGAPYALPSLTSGLPAVSRIFASSSRTPVAVSTVASASSPRTFARIFMSNSRPSYHTKWLRWSGTSRPTG